MRTPSRHVAAAAMLVTASFALAACGSSGSTSSAPAAAASSAHGCDREANGGPSRPAAYTQPGLAMNWSA